MKHPLPGTIPLANKPRPGWALAAALIMVLLVGRPETSFAAPAAETTDVQADDGLNGSHANATSDDFRTEAGLHEFLKEGASDGVQKGKDRREPDPLPLPPLLGRPIDVGQVYRHVAVKLADGESERSLLGIQRDYGIFLASRSKLGQMFGVYLFESYRGQDARTLAEKMSRDPRIAFVEAMQEAKLASAVPFDNYVWSIITPSELMEQYAIGMLDMGATSAGGGGWPGKNGFGSGFEDFSSPLRASVDAEPFVHSPLVAAAREAIGEAPVMSTNRLLELYGSGLGGGAHGITRGAGITVAVIDTGFDRDHPALDGAWTHPITHVDFVDNDMEPEEAANGIDDDGDGEIDEAFGHGTFVAGIVHLIAPDADIMPIRVLNDDGQAHEYEVAMAINHAIQNGADVINLSLVIPNHSSLLASTLENAALAGISVIAAAGNEGVQTVHYPAGDDCSIAVTAIDENRFKSSFANYGSWVDLSTPGEVVYSAFPVTPIPGSPGQHYYYAAWSGSSVATPFAAGQAALLRSLNPLLGAATISRFLASSAQSVDAMNPAYAGLLGRGLPQVTTSLQNLLVGILPGSEHDLLSACPTAY